MAANIIFYQDPCCFMARISPGVRLRAVRSAFVFLWDMNYKSSRSIAIFRRNNRNRVINFRCTHTLPLSPLLGVRKPPVTGRNPRCAILLLSFYWSTRRTCARLKFVRFPLSNLIMFTLIASNRREILSQQLSLLVWRTIWSTVDVLLAGANKLPGRCQLNYLVHVRLHWNPV